jgi:hypothetical protein
MVVHKDCYSAIDLTQQDGPHRRETPQRILVADMQRKIKLSLWPKATCRSESARSLAFQRTIRLVTRWQKTGRPSPPARCIPIVTLLLYNGA